jgi:hypothetical protein
MSECINYCCVATQSPFTRTNQYPKRVPKAEIDQVIDAVLKKVNQSDHRRTLTHNSGFDIHYKVSKGVCFLCVADTHFKKRICFGLLDDLEQQWEKGNIKGSRGDTVLKERMNYFNYTKNDVSILFDSPLASIQNPLFLLVASLSYRNYHC